MSPSRVFVVVSILSLLTIRSVNAQQNGGNPALDNQSLMEGILREDRTAIRAAALSGDSVFVPSLKKALADIKALGIRRTSGDNETASLLRHALIKLDDRDTQQQFWCWAIHESTWFPAEYFQDFGGWYSIQALDAVLGGAGNAAFLRAIHREQPTDVSYAAPILFVLRALPIIVPNGPTASELSVDTNVQWRAWIAAHRDELRSLKPTGAGVDFTESACKNGKPRVAPATEGIPIGPVMEGILKGDLASIRRAGDSENALFVPYLKTALAKGISASPNRSGRRNTRRTLRNALVALDDTATQQQFWCWLIRENLDFRIESLDDVGGWFSLQGLDAVLSGVGHKRFSHEAKFRDYYRDTKWLSPAEHAVGVLPRIVSNGPFGPNGDLNISQSDAVRAWQEWIRAHREDLHSLKPTGDGVVFTERACQNIRVDRDW